MIIPALYFLNFSLCSPLSYPNLPPKRNHVDSAINGYMCLSEKHVRKNEVYQRKMVLVLPFFMTLLIKEKKEQIIIQGSG